MTIISLEKSSDRHDYISPLKTWFQIEVISQPVIQIVYKKGNLLKDCFSYGKGYSYGFKILHPKFYTLTFLTITI
jgi:hypothetical protein